MAEQNAPSTTTSTGAASGGPPPAPSPGLDFIIMLFPMILIFYLLILRPESKRRKQKETLLASLKVKDKVITIGGLQATVAEIDGDDVILLADPKKDVKLRFRRSAIEGVVQEKEKEKS